MIIAWYQSQIQSNSRQSFVSGEGCFETKSSDSVFGKGDVWLLRCRHRRMARDHDRCWRTEGPLHPRSFSRSGLRFLPTLRPLWRSHGLPVAVGKQHLDGCPPQPPHIPPWFHCVVATSPQQRVSLRGEQNYHASHVGRHIWPFFFSFNNTVKVTPSGAPL